MAVIVNGQEVLLSGTVGADWFDDGFTLNDVAIALAPMDGDITVRLNSGGGIATEGSAIYSALMHYPGAVEVVVEGIAASAASIIAMAGDTITMADGSVMMIHDPLNITFGNSAEHAKTIEALEALATGYARIYAKRSGKTVDECRDIMRAETWYDGPAAIEAGFASGPATGKAKAVAAYDYRDYDHTPKRLAALAKAKNWSISDYRPLSTEAPGAVPALADHKEPTMTDKERADALAAELATANAAKELAEASLAALQASASTEAVASADAAVKADRDRRAAIMALPEAKGREALAEVLFADGATADKAKAFLGAAPVAVAAVADPTAAYEAARLAGGVVNASIAGAVADTGWKQVVANYNKHITK